MDRRPTHELLADVIAAASAFDPALITAGQAVDEVRHWAAIEKAAAGARLVAAGRVAETTVWVDHGERSAADLVARAAGTSVGAAAADLETARRLTHLPATRDALLAGDLSPEQARLVADGATADPTAERRLLDTASAGTFKGLVDESKRVQAAATDDATRAAKIHARRSFTMGTNAQGEFTATLRGPAATAVPMIALFKAIIEDAFRATRTLPAAERGSYENRCWDAITTFLNTLTTHQRTKTPRPTTARPDAAPGPTPRCPASREQGQPRPSRQPAVPPAGPDTESQLQMALEHDPGPPHGCTGSQPAQDAPTPIPDDDGDGDGDGDGDAPANPGELLDQLPVINLPGGDNTKVIVRIDYTALVRGHTTPGETCEIAGIGPVSVHTVAELLATGDPFLTAVITKGHDVHTVAHLGRHPNAHQRTALEALSIQCTNIRCNTTIGIQIDHRTEWHKIFRTHLPDLDPLCPNCHRLKTHHGHRLAPGTGRRPLLPPGAPPPAAPPNPEPP